MDSSKVRHLLTRIGLGVVLLAFGIWEILQPAHWAGFLPIFVAQIANPLTVVVAHGTVLLILGIAILSGFYLRITSIIAAIFLITIVVSLIMLTGYNDLVIRDVGLSFLALSIVFDNERFLTVTK